MTVFVFYDSILDLFGYVVKMIVHKIKLELKRFIKKI